MVYRGSNYSGGGTAWLLQRISGLILLFMLLTHFWLLHYGTEGEITYSKVASRLSTPFWKTFDLVFLVLALYHGLNGIWAIVLDYVHRDWLRITIFNIICFLGLVLMVLGTLTIVPFKL